MSNTFTYIKNDRFMLYVALYFAYIIEEHLDLRYTNETETSELLIGVMFLIWISNNIWHILFCFFFSNIWFLKMFILFLIGVIYFPPLFFFTELNSLQFKFCTIKYCVLVFLIIIFLIIGIPKKFWILVCCRQLPRSYVFVVLWINSDCVLRVYLKMIAVLLKFTQGRINSLCVITHGMVVVQYQDETKAKINWCNLWGSLFNLSYYVQNAICSRSEIKL